MNRPASTTAVVIGRFQLPHLAHLRLIQAAFGLADQVVIVIGSAWRSRNPRNPFVWEERRDMLLHMMTREQQQRVRFTGVRDVYDDARWVGMVRERVARFCEPDTAITLVGHVKDASSHYLQRFPGWGYVDAGSATCVDSTALRALYFGGARPTTDLLAEMAPVVHERVREYLAAWALTGPYEARVAEHLANEAYKLKYPGPVYQTGDAIIEAAGHFLLIERGGELGRGTHAFPGGHQEPGESGVDTAVRELAEETTLGVSRDALLQSLVATRKFDAPGRSPRGRIETTACHFRLAGFTPESLPVVHGRDDAKSQPALWLNREGLERVMCQMFDDHDCIAEFAAGELQPLVERQAIAAPHQRQSPTCARSNTASCCA